MAGTRRTVVLAIVRIPPTMTRATAPASSRPTSQPRPARTLASAPVMSVRIAAAWFDWNMLPMPRQPSTSAAA